MKTNQTGKDQTRARGFSLIEMAISLVILTVVIGVVFRGVTEIEQRKSVENSKLDLVQESREFMDQIVNDIHQSGYPTSRMFDPNGLAPAPCPAFVQQTVTINNVPTVMCPPNMANGVGGNGLNSATATSVQFEADVDGTGVSEVFVQLVQRNGANAPPCTAPPCVIQRGTITKAAWLGGAVPVYYTEVSQIMNTNIFTAYDNMGNQIVPPAATTQAALANITDIGITLYVRADVPDMRTGQFPTVTMISDAKIRLN